MKFLQAAGADFMGMGPTLPLSNSAAEVLHKLEDLRKRTQVGINVFVSEIYILTVINF